MDSTVMDEAGGLSWKTGMNHAMLKQGLRATCPCPWEGLELTVLLSLLSLIMAFSWEWTFSTFWLSVGWKIWIFLLIVLQLFQPIQSQKDENVHYSCVGVWSFTYCAVSLHQTGCGMVTTKIWGWYLARHSSNIFMVISCRHELVVLSPLLLFITRDERDFISNSYSNSFCLTEHNYHKCPLYFTCIYYLRNINKGSLRELCV